ncbi:MAG TPA: sugar porter family MFS transporter [Nonomuraea sp.]|nr:sugar porter family MFS transporter [Nonomuraea sp.]
MSNTAIAGTTDSRRLPVFVALSAILIGTVYGYDTGSIASAILFIEPEFELSTFMTTMVVSSVTFGTLAGALVGGWIANAVGRKRTMVGVAVSYTLFTGGQALAVDEWSLIAVRLLLGLVVGISIVTAPLFISESAPRRVRGRMLVSFQFATVAGIVIAYFVGLSLAHTENWRLILALGFIPALIVALMLSRLPDTSRWYLMRGRRTEALAALSRVEPDDDPEQAARLIEEDLRSTKKGTYRQLFSGRYKRAGIFVVGLGLFVQLTGINAVVYYSPLLLQDVGFEAAGNALLLAALIQLAGLLATTTAFFVIDRWGRRPVLITGLTIMVIANAILVAGFLLDNAQMMTVIGLFVFLIGYSFGYGALLWVYVGEALPAQLRAIGGSALLTADLAANIVIAMFFLNALTLIGGAATFAVFLVLSVGALVFCYFLAPETKGRRLEDIGLYWENGASWPSDAEIADLRQAERTR